MQLDTKIWKVRGDIWTILTEKQNNRDFVCELLICIEKIESELLFGIMKQTDLLI